MASLITFDQSFKTHFNEAIIKTLMDANLIAGLGDFRKSVRPIIAPGSAQSEKR